MEEIEQQRRTLSQVTGRWLGDKPVRVIRRAYAAYVASPFPNLGTLGRILGA